MTASAGDILTVIVLCGIFGMVGQLIRVIAGVVALLASQGIDKPVAYNTKLALAIMAAGYAGTDFIEAFMRKYLPGR